MRKGLMRTVIGAASAALLTAGAVVPAVADAAVAPGCRTAKASVNIQARGASVRAGAFNMEQVWCWDGYKVTSVAPPTTWGSITALGRTLGFSYAGEISRNGFDYWPQNGGNWAYQTEVQAKFTYCPPRVACLSPFLPRIRFDLYGDGVYHSTGA
jgi:hypothetical protein